VGEKMSLFVDASVIVKAFTENPDKEACKQVLRKPFVTNALCLVEAQHRIARITRDRVHASTCVKGIFGSEAKIVALDRNLLFEAFRRIGQYDLTTPDLIHYVIALLNESQEFISYDKDFDNLEIKRTEP
jgi:predicted nucleic acid-binding protein